MAVTKRRIKVKSNYSFSSRSKRLVFLLLPTRLSVFLFRRFIDDNRERNALEAAKHLVDTNDVYPTRFHQLLPKFLKFSLNLGGVELPSNYLNFLSRSLVQTRRSPTSRQKVREDAIIETKKLPWQLLNPQGWKLLSLALSGFGLIRAGAVARDNCLKSALNEMSLNTASERTLNLAICGLLESRRFDEARSCIEKFSKSLSSEAISNVYGVYLELMKQPRPNSSAPDSKTSSPTDRLFSNLIVGKNIALVAPGVITTESGAEIDAHDTVVRIKFNGKSAMPDQKFVGKRCDITSHNSELLTIASHDQESLMSLLNDADDLKLFIAKKGDFKSIGKIPVKGMKAWPPTFLTTGTSGTLILFELLTALPKKLKLYGFDFYSNRNIYNDNLMETYRKSEAPDGGSPKDHTYDQGLFSIHSIARSNISHDLKSDFLLIKNLYELSGLIDGTPEVIALLNLTADEYDLKLEEMLGDW